MTKKSKKFQIVPDSSTASPPSAGSEVGNTDNSEPAKKQPPPCKHWCFTFNNYTKSEIVPIVAEFQLICEKYVFQEEIGENGTKHLQGYIELINKKRLTALKKINDKIHWEKCNNIDGSIKYCSDASKRKTYGDIWVKGINIGYQGEDLPKKLYEWQKILRQKLIVNAPDKRTVTWIYDQIGNKGKSTFCKFMAFHHDAICVMGGAKKDILFHIINKTKREIILIDIPRSQRNKISFSAIEQLKNGHIFSEKYESKDLMFKPPHIVIFSNFPPDMSQLSEDRWQIMNI